MAEKEARADFSFWFLFKHIWRLLVILWCHFTTVL